MCNSVVGVFVLPDSVRSFHNNSDLSIRPGVSLTVRVFFETLLTSFHVPVQVRVDK